MHTTFIERQPYAPPTSLEQLYAEQHLRLRRYVQRIVGDWETAEDVAQDTFVKALRSWSRREPAASAHTWLYRIATNTAFDELRRRRRTRMVSYLVEQVPEGADPSFESQVAAADAVHQALREVPELFRAALLLHVYDGQAVDEIARRLNVPVGTVKSRLFRARAHARRAYTCAAGA